MMRVIVLICVFVCGGMNVWGSNLRIQHTPKLLQVVGNTATLEFTLSWDNSWKNIYNCDAVYVFGKYKSVDKQGWNHIKWTESGHEVVEDGYMITSAEAGLFVRRSVVGEGNSEVTLRLQWQLEGSQAMAAALQAGQLLFQIEGIEMVYVPSASFYAGDGTSAGSYSSVTFGSIPARYDIIGTSTNYTYTASGGTNVAKAADRIDNSLNINNCWYNAATPSWWQVDFKTGKTIKYFGISALWNSDAYPGGTWALKGSTDGTNWQVLWEGSPEEWSLSRISYPVQRGIKVTNPDNYRYYRIEIPSVSDSRKPYYSDVRIANIAMTEQDLDISTGESVLIDGSMEDIPDTYPTGYTGFYAMKYELTQEQYVDFLNKLTYSGQYTRTIGGKLDGLNPGDYLFGENRKIASHRNGIVLLEKGTESTKAAIFGCNLNPENLPNSLDDGQSVACNYLCIADMLAYADWAGLRPLSELEYEKMCRYPSSEGFADAQYAWGTKGIQLGNNLQEPGQESEYLSSGNVNAAHPETGPIRSGAFVRAGRGRADAGVSFWGIEDLTGNLAEIYYNSEVYGKQLNRHVMGDGILDEFGRYNIEPSEWPENSMAFGLRGGSFADEVADLSVSDRSRMTGEYFRASDERKAEVGFRLGYNVEPDVFESQLTLQNGKRSGNVLVYDTVCGNNAYLIEGDGWEDASETGVYTWYTSTDGMIWVPLKGEGHKNLWISGLTEDMDNNTTKSVYYKRLVSVADRIAESGIVGLFVSNGYVLDRLRDTLLPCMETPGFTVHTPLPAKFEWYSVETGNLLEPASVDGTSSHYDVAVADFRSSTGEQPSGLYYVGLKVTIAERCVMNRKLEVWVENRTFDPYPSVTETFAYNTAGEYEVTHKWGGRDSWTWSIGEHMVSSVRIDAGKGVLSGQVDTLDPLLTVGLVCNDCPDAVWEKNMKEVRTMTYVTANYQTIFLLPGAYRMECWGAGGGYDRGSGALVASEVYGGYTAGYIRIENERPFYIYAGQRGPNAVVRAVVPGGWNGGGRGDWDHADDEASGGGGGAADIRLLPGAWNDFESLKSRIMVAAAGGGASDGVGIAGGGLNGYASKYSTGGTQTGGCGFGRGCDGIYTNSNVNVGGGGGGYYGGYAKSSGAANTYQASGAGGSSFISGHPGCNAITESSVNGAIVHTGKPYHYSGFYFTDTQMIDGKGYNWNSLIGSYVGMPSPTAAGVMKGNNGNGYVRISVQ